MTGFLLCLFLLFSITHHSSAIYCICRDGVGESALQRDIDYACGSGADCSAILQNGACFNPNTVKDHCNYAVNSYFQRRGQVPGSCNFSGTATTADSIPSMASGCVYASSPSSTGTPTTGTPTTGTPTTGTPTMGTPSTTTPTTGTPSTTVPGSSTTPSVFGFGPTASVMNPNGNSNGSVHLLHSTNLFYSFALAFLVSLLMSLRV